MSKPNYRVPQPDRLRRIDGSFAWIDHRLLRNGYLPIMTLQDQGLYLFLALAADRHGVSFYRKEKICHVLGLDFADFEIARDRLRELGLIAFQPYSALTVNGFYQVLPVDRQARPFTLPPAPSTDTHTPARPHHSSLPSADPIQQLAASFRTV